MQCSCDVEWCYCCGRVEAECNRQAGHALMGHQVDWKKNPRRCPLYLQELHTLDAKTFDDNPQQVLAVFHRQLTLRGLQAVVQKHGAKAVRNLLHIIPQALQGYTLEEIEAFKLHPFFQARW